MSEYGPNPLVHVQIGMTVYDAEGDQIGEVDLVYPGQSLVANLNDIPGELEALTDDLETSDHLIIEAYPEIRHPDDIPPEIVDRMLHEGYLLVARPGLQEVGEVILPDQIDSVSQEGVYLVP